MSDDDWTQRERMTEIGAVIEVRPRNVNDVQRVHVRAPELLCERVIVRRVGSLGRAVVTPFQYELALDGETISYFAVRSEEGLRWVQHGPIPPLSAEEEAQLARARLGDFTGYYEHLPDGTSRRL